jgi:rSAM/selenodomain-associated transferase 2/rSAM/selenodomain-associated transferase 1
VSRETLILFTRFPLAGRAKTRLIPRLGPEGAAQVQREMTEHMLARAWPLLSQRGVKLEVRFEDGSAADMRRWLGNGFSLTPQGSGDLGARLLRATTDAFNAGMQRVVVIGADCPDLDSTSLERAFSLLTDHPLVFGPAKDGGYYLVGLSEPRPELFRDIPWSTSQVLATSVARAQEAGAQPVLLPELSDVDQPADLETWDRARRASRTLSIIIPTLNEAAQLPETLQHARTIQPVEIIVADGGSRDDTLRIAESHGAIVVTGASTRGQQMNAGAAQARGETLLFLHADTLLPANYHEIVTAALRPRNTLGGAFAFKIRDPFPPASARWLVELTTNCRSRVWRMPYGDQALFVRRWAFEQLGGFPNLPIMEDYAFVRRLRRLGKLAILDAPALASGRRWKRLGFFRTTVTNQLMILGYHCGISPAKLAGFYRGQIPRPPSALPASHPETV